MALSANVLKFFFQFLKRYLLPTYFLIIIYVKASINIFFQGKVTYSYFMLNRVIIIYLHFITANIYCFLYVCILFYMYTNNKCLQYLSPLYDNLKLVAHLVAWTIKTLEITKRYFNGSTLYT